MRHTMRALIILSLALAGPAQADIVTEWNERAVDAGYKSGLTAPVMARNVTLVQLAVFDALNSLEPRYSAYRLNLPPDKTASSTAAAASAAYQVLVNLYPNQ